MKKFKEWFHNGGQEFLESFTYVVGGFLILMICALIGSFIRNLPLFYETVAKTLISLGEF